MVHRAFLVVPMLLFTWSTAVALNCYSEEPDPPEAAAMFERLVLRIPAGTDPTELCTHVGKTFRYCIHSGNTKQQETAMVPFVVGGRLYCIHCLRTDTPIITVFHVLQFDPKYSAHTVAGAKMVKQWDKSSDEFGFAQAADLLAVIDKHEPDEKIPFEFTIIHTTQQDKIRPLAKP